MTTIPAHEIKIDPSSYIDSAGRVFFWNDRVFRGISAAHAPFVKRLLAQQVIQNLHERGMLVRTWTPIERAEGFEMILEHERIQFPSYCMEWTPQMLKDAALLTLHIGFELSDHDLTLQDAYPWNIFFAGARPVFIDFGSIMEARDDALWAPYDQFCNFFLFPLYLYSAGLYDFARGRLFDYLSGVNYAQFIKLAPFSLKVKYLLRYGKLAATHHIANLVKRFGWEERLRHKMKKALAHVDLKRGREKFFESLIKEVEAIRLPRRNSFWARYYSYGTCSYKDEELQTKEAVVRSVLEKYCPRSVVDIGCNTGMFSRMAAAQGCRVVAFDTDAASVEQLYLMAKDALEDITTLVIDVLNPTSRFGWCGKQFPAAYERVKGDMVFAFALIHGNRFQQYLLSISGRGFPLTPAWPLALYQSYFSSPISQLSRLLKVQSEAHSPPERVGGPGSDNYALALDYLTKRQSKNSFLWIHQWAPHQPYIRSGGPFLDEPSSYTYESVMQELVWRGPPLDPQYEPLARKLRLMSEEYIAGGDAALGRFLEILKSEGLFDNSMIIISADHGQAFEKGDLFHLTGVMYEQTARIPLIIHMPGQSKGKRIKTLASHTDLMPTILDTLGLSVPEWMEGESLWKYIKQEQDKPIERTIFSQAIPEGLYFAKTDDVKQLHTFLVYKGDYKLIYRFYANRRFEEVDPPESAQRFLERYPQIELFNLTKDPNEGHNIADTELKIKDELVALARKRIEKTKKIRNAL